MSASCIDWLDDDTVRLIARFRFDTPPALAAFARCSHALSALLAPMLSDLKTLLVVSRRAHSVTSIAQLRRLGTLLFHEQHFSAAELSSLSLVLSSACMPYLTELCFYGDSDRLRARPHAMDDDGLIALPVSYTHLTLPTKA